MSIGSALLLQRVRAAIEDEYTIEGELGRGGMAAVFLARDLSLDRKVAIKVMLPDLVDVAGLQDRFVSEAKTAASLDHPGIVTVYSVKQRDGLLFIIMKYVEGQTLDEVLKLRGPLEPPLVAALGARLAEALHFAHNEGIIHRDIKPSNVIIDKRGRPVITDFGIAKVMSARSVTVAGSMLGTPTYMSPEQCRGLTATAASDQYSLGIMMYEMLSGRVPFTGGLYELIHAHSLEAPPPLRSLVPRLDPLLEDTVMKMLAKEPAERWATLSAVAKRLTSPKAAEAMTQFIAPTASPDDATLPIGVMSPLELRGSEAVSTPASGLLITPDEPTIEAGSSIQLTASGPAGARLASQIVWQSEDPNVAAVDHTGLVTGRDAGFAKITATSGGAFGRTGVTIVPKAASTVVIHSMEPAAAAVLPDTLGARPPRRSTTAVARRQRNIGLFVGIAGAFLGGIATVIILQNRTPAPSAGANAPTQSVQTSAPPPNVETPPPSTGATGSTGASGTTGTSGATLPTVSGTGRTDTARSATGRADSVRPAPVRSRRDSIPPARQATRLDSATAEQCRKLRERWSVGDSLTTAEERMLRGVCTR